MADAIVPALIHAGLWLLIIAGWSLLLYRGLKADRQLWRGIVAQLRLFMAQLIAWPQRVSYGAGFGLVGIGAFALLAIMLEFLPLHVGRYALALQLIALLVGLLATRRLTQRLVLYPLLVACMLYLWDTTLPPPSLPEGPFRHMLGHGFFIGLVADVFRTWHRQAPAAVTRGPFIRLASAARVLHTSPQQLRQELNQAGRIVLVQFEGEEYILGEDFAFLWAQRSPDQ